ncbi:MAG: transglycosylase SLT domain-containing protein, partial [Nitrospinae bacterium]|nr:transglycosylase SLT domain-containing protein [Nitrospinota bacterium]
LLLGQGYEGLGLQEKAIIAFRTLYVQFPASPEANRAAARIEAWLPPERRFPGGLTLSERLERADRLAEAAECARAMPEVQRLSPDSLPHDLQARAIARLGLCAFKLRRYSEAAATLERFRQALVADERAAEALYVLGAARQRERRMAEAEQVFLQLAAREPATSWNAKALVALGSLYEGRQDTTQAIAAYTQLTTRFPGDDRADEMAWRIGWLRYGRQLFGAAVGDFATAADRFPRSMFVSNALYWQAKALERSGESAQATALYERVAQAYPYTYYGIRAMEVALARAPLRNAPGDDSIAANTRVHLAPARKRTVELTLAPAATFHRIRVEELLALRFMGEAREELLHLAKRLGEGFPEQMFLARLYLALGLTSQAIRALNAVLASLTPSERLDLPDAFWKLLFPQFYWEAIQDGARLTQLDPLLVMGVIRQESAFNPRAISRSDARGLMQLLPSTGQEIFQRLGLGAFRGDVLFDPRINVRLGTHYLARLATAHQGNLIPTLAAYNAGPTRVKRWLQEVRFADWDEFIENLPFEETRGYVKNVLRNYGVYRRLYALGNETTDEHR